MPKLLHITPQLPPAICGVGDYATAVGVKMESLDSSIECRYLALGNAANSTPRKDRVPAWFWDAVFEAAGGGHRTLPSDRAIVLHYSGYGYSPDGAPEWLAKAIEECPLGWQGVRILTFFHELYASSPPWRRAYWQSGRQRRVAERIARASGAMITNREQSARWLAEVTGRPTSSVPYLPVPSNVGEPEVVPAYEERLPNAVVFGGARHKQPFLAGRGVHRTAETCRRLGITRLTDIGAKCDIVRPPFDASGVEVVQMGYLPSEEITSLLLDARVGFISYFPGYLDKSGVFAAFTAHGLAVYASPALDNEVRLLLGIDDGVASPVGASRRAGRAVELRRRFDSTAHANMLLRLSNLTQSVGAST